MGENKHKVVLYIIQNIGSGFIIVTLDLICKMLSISVIQVPRL